MSWLFVLFRSTGCKSSSETVDAENDNKDACSTKLSVRQRDWRQGWLWLHWSWRIWFRFQGRDRGCCRCAETVIQNSSSWRKSLAYLERILIGDRFSIGFLPRSVDVAISKSRARPAISRDFWGWTSFSYVPCVAVHGERCSFSVEKEDWPLDIGDSKTCTDSLNCSYSKLNLMIDIRSSRRHPIYPLRRYSSRRSPRRMSTSTCLIRCWYNFIRTTFFWTLTSTLKSPTLG